LRGSASRRSARDSHARSRRGRRRRRDRPARAARGTRVAARRACATRRSRFDPRARRVLDRAGRAGPHPRSCTLYHHPLMTSEADCRSQITRAVRAAIATDREHGAVVPPIHLSSTFAFEGFAKPRKFDYTRSGNPTRSQLADAIAELEGGATGVITGTG